MAADGVFVAVEAERGITCMNDPASIVLTQNKGAYTTTEQMHTQPWQVAGIFENMRENPCK
jgi:glutathione synthase/RimK-type ligase-like ATP-grasp enzyme